MKLKDLNLLQINYIRTSQMLNSIGYPDDLLDDLFREVAKTQKENNNQLKQNKNVY